MMPNSEYRHNCSPFPHEKTSLASILTNLTRVTHKGQVLKFPQPIGRHLPRRSPVSFRSDTLYTLWMSTKGLCKAFHQLIESHGSRCNGRNRATIFFGRLDINAFWNGSNSQRKYLNREQNSGIASDLLCKERCLAVIEF